MLLLLGTTNEADERSQLEKALTEARRIREEEGEQRKERLAKYDVSRLPIHNIRLKKPQGNIANGNISGSFNGDSSISMRNVGWNSNSLKVGDKVHASELTSFAKEDQSVIPELYMLTGDGAGTYLNLVSRGAFCTGSSNRHKWSVNAIFNERNIELESHFDVYIFKSRAGNVLAQSVALEYDFFVRSEPIGVRCNMDIAKFRSFAVKSGSSSILFWRNSWSEVDRKRMDQSGITCNILMSPTGEIPDHNKQ